MVYEGIVMVLVGTVIVGVCVVCGRRHCSCCSELCWHIQM